MSSSLNRRCAALSHTSDLHSRFNCLNYTMSVIHVPCLRGFFVMVYQRNQSSTVKVVISRKVHCAVTARRESGAINGRSTARSGVVEHLVRHQPIATHPSRRVVDTASTTACPVFRRRAADRPGAAAEQTWVYRCRIDCFAAARRVRRG